MYQIYKMHNNIFKEMKAIMSHSHWEISQQKQKKQNIVINFLIENIFHMCLPYVCIICFERLNIQTKKVLCFHHGHLSVWFWLRFFSQVDTCSNLQLMMYTHRQKWYNKKCSVYLPPMYKHIEYSSRWDVIESLTCIMESLAINMVIVCNEHKLINNQNCAT